MDKNSAEARFKEADRLYRDGRFAAALDLLKDLDARFPNQKNILLPMARSLSKLGRTEEALHLCNEIVDKFDYDRATELRNRIMHDGAEGPVTPGVEEEHFSFESLDLTIDDAPAGVTRRNRSAVHPLVKIGAVTAIVVAAFAVWYVMLW